jgi:hypothetical protein
MQMKLMNTIKYPCPVAAGIRQKQKTVPYGSPRAENVPVAARALPARSNFRHQGINKRILWVEKGGRQNFLEKALLFLFV